MPASYQLADKIVKELCEKIVIAHHTDLDSAAVKFDIIFGFRDPEDESGKPALEKDGHRILGTTKIISLKDRVKGMGDAEIILDGDAWGSMDILKKKAVIDHCLQSFEMKRDNKGNFVYDDINRPVVKIRPHDRVIRFFDVVAQRHTSNSIEAAQLTNLFLQAGQTYLPLVPEKAKGVLSEEGSAE